MTQSASRPNLVLVSIDSLRADHCGYLGDDRGLTPTLDALADEGVAFRNAVAPGPQTFSSMPAVFTGTSRPPTLLENPEHLSYWERRLRSIADHLETHGSLASRLRDLGYETAGFSPNPWTTSNSGFDAGFDHFAELGGETSRLNRALERVPGIDTDSRGVQLATSMVTGSSFFARWPSFYDDLRDRVEALSEPYFLWVFLLDTHFPFVAGRAHRTEQSLLGTYLSNYRTEGALRDDAPAPSTEATAAVQRSYRDTVRAADDFLATLREDLAADDPVTVVHSDHGESFGDHGNWGHHHRRVYEENVHVPLVVHGGGTSADVADPTSLASIHDGVLATARQGQFDPAAVTAEVAYASSECGTHRAVRGQRFKYVETDGKTVLYDLRADPEESTDCSAAHPDREAALAQRLSDCDGHREETTRLGRAAAAVAAGETF